jgi:Antibiotic biosynthesis monooxygenase
MSTAAHPKWRSVLHVHARPGRIDELRALFETEPIFMAAMEVGCRGTELLVGAEELVVLAEWDEPSDYQSWVESPVRARWAPAIDALSDTRHGDIYRLVSVPSPQIDDP